MAKKLDLDPTTPGYLNAIIHSGGPGFLYGSSYRTVVRYDESLQLSNGHVFDSGSIVRMWATSIPGEVFILWRTTDTSLYTLYRSTDYGDTVQISTLLGYDPDTEAQLSSVYMLERCFCEASIGGVRTLFVAEYGADGAPHRLLKSEDSGVSWATLATWNVGTYNITHIHGVVQDPFSKDIYLFTGDSNDGSGIIRWEPGVGVWQDATNIADFDALPGFSSIAGAQRYRVVDLIFTEDAIYSIPDSTSTAFRGINRCDKDLTNWRVINNDLDGVTGHYGWTGLRTPDGNLLLMDSLTSAATDGQLRVWASEGGDVWRLVGLFGARPTGVATPRGLFYWNDKVVICVPYYPAGKENTGATVFLKFKQEKFDGEFPTILHPVYWVSKTGSDANNGWTSETPWLTVNHALTGNRITDGARVIFGPGEFAETARIRPEWKANAYPGTGTVTIEGVGKNETKVFMDADAPHAVFILFDANGYSALCRKIHILSKKAGAYSIYCGVPEATQVSLAFEDAIVGDLLYSGAGIVAAGAISFYRSILRGTLLASVSEAAQCDIFALCSIFISPPSASIRAVTLSHGAISRFSFCIFDGYTDTGAGIRMSSGLAVVPVVKGCIFIGAGPAMSDAAGLTETSDEIDYNVCTKASGAWVNISAGANANKLPDGTDPKILADYTLALDSPCLRFVRKDALGAGAPARIVDIRGNIYRPAPYDKLNIGADQAGSDAAMRSATGGVLWR